tara:strand:- start:2267 stop:2380 length:114 start_codon:yes stop_codon:yes gene_type:complete
MKEGGPLEYNRPLDLAAKMPTFEGTGFKTANSYPEFE